MTLTPCPQLGQIRASGGKVAQTLCRVKGFAPRRDSTAHKGAQASTLGTDGGVLPPVAEVSPGGTPAQLAGVDTCATPRRSLCLGSPGGLAWRCPVQPGAVVLNVQRARVVLF